MLLNHDTVFLAELLTHHAGGPEWTAAYRSFNCLAKPKEIVPILDYAAAVTVVLAHYRVADHCDDSGSWHWRAVRRLLSPQFRKASARLRAWDFPMDELEALLRTQSAREADPQSLADVAEPTAIATEMVFAHGARFAGDSAALGRIGHRFGYLIYVLDAFEDLERDRRNGAFNALARFPEIDGRREILRTLEEIDLPDDLQARLRTNVEERLGMRPRVLCCVSRKTLRYRWRDAVVFARKMRERERVGVAVFASAVAIALLFPHHARGAMSSRECLTVPFNLMALGTFFAAPVESPVENPKKGCLDRIGCCNGGCCDCDGGCCDCCGDCACDGCCDC
jgi:hypothetical protein